MKKTTNVALIELSKQVREARRAVSEELAQRHIIPTKEEKIIFFKYPDYLINDLLLSTKWLFNGFIIQLGSFKLLVDPGAELLCRMNNIQDLLSTNTLFISHAHIDHYTSANIALEFMSLPLKDKQITIIAPKTVFKEKLISDYHAGIKKGIGNINRIILKDAQISVHEVKIDPILLHHSIKDTYGFNLSYHDIKIGYITDTGYSKKFETSTGETYESGVKIYNGEFRKIKSKFNYIKNAVKDVNVLIITINDLIFNKHSKYHMTGYDLIDILKDSNIKQCFIANLHPVDLLRKNLAEKIAKYISKLSGVNTLTIPVEGLEYTIN